MAYKEPVEIRGKVALKRTKKDELIEHILSLRAQNELINATVETEAQRINQRTTIPIDCAYGVTALEIINQCIERNQVKELLDVLESNF